MLRHQVPTAAPAAGCRLLLRCYRDRDGSAGGRDRNRQKRRTPLGNKILSAGGILNVASEHAGWRRYIVFVRPVRPSTNANFSASAIIVSKLT